MATLAVKMDIPHAVSVTVDENTLTVELDDGRHYRFRLHGIRDCYMHLRKKGMVGV